MGNVNTPGARRLVLLAVIFCVSRFVLLLFNFDAFFFFEEFHTGTVAHDMAHGLRYPLFHYQDMSHTGETLLLGALGAPLFSLFGETAFTLKYTTLIIYAASLLVLFITCDRFINRQTAWGAALLFCFAPPLWIWTTLKPMYQHSESFLFIIAGAYFFFTYLAAPAQRARALLAAGLILGLGTWYVYSTLLAVAALAICWLLAARHTITPAALLLAGGGMAGGLALRFIQAVHDGALTLSVYGLPLYKTFTVNPPARSLAKLWQTLALHLPNSFSFRWTPWSWLYYLITLGAAAALLQHLWHNRRQTHAGSGMLLFTAIYPPLFLILFAFSHFDIDPLTPDGYRYLAPLYPFFFITIAFAFSRCHNAGRTVRIAFAGVIIMTATAGYADLFRAGPPSSGDGWAYRGWSDKAFDWLYGVKGADAVINNPAYLALANHEHHTHYFHEQLFPFTIILGMPPARALALIRSMPAARQALYYGGLGRVDLAETDRLTLVPQIPEPYRPFFFENAGAADGEAAWTIINFYNATRETYATYLAGRLATAAQIPEQYRAYYSEGLGRGLALVLCDPAILDDGFLAAIATADRADFCTGLGRMLGFQYGATWAERQRACSHFSEQYRRYLLQGAGLEAAYDVFDNTREAADVCRAALPLPQVERQAFFRGLGRGAYRTGLAAAAFAIAEPDTALLFANGYAYEQNR